MSNKEMTDGEDMQNSNAAKPEQVENLSTKVTDEELAEAITDEYGVKYSKDGKKLLSAKGINNQVNRYVIREGAKLSLVTLLKPKYLLA